MIWICQALLTGTFAVSNYCVILPLLEWLIRGHTSGDSNFQFAHTLNEICTAIDRVECIWGLVSVCLNNIYIYSKAGISKYAILSRFAGVFAESGRRAWRDVWKPQRQIMRICLWSKKSLFAQWRIHGEIKSDRDEPAPLWSASLAVKSVPIRFTLTDLSYIAHMQRCGKEKNPICANHVRRIRGFT